MIIIQDTREQQPWNFNIYSKCTGQKIATLHTGDYTVEGLEDIICIERKRSTGEIATNLGSKAKQFEAEFQRMSEYQYAYLVCEFSADILLAFPKGSGIPKKQWPKIRMNGKFMYKRLMDWCEKYDVICIFANDKCNAEKEVIKILHERYTEKT